MGIVYYSNGSAASSREQVIQYLRERKARGPVYSVLDVGGRSNPWADELVDAYVDLVDFDTERRKYIGDINEDPVWREIENDGQYDFSICTHTVEDLRDPIFVLTKLAACSKAGYIAVPNKHCEFSHPESSCWLGYAHHRWAFSIKTRDDGRPYLFLMPKWPCVEYFNERKIVVAGPVPALQYGENRLAWVNSDLASPSNELGLMWEDDFDFEAVDYSISTQWQIWAYRELLKDGL